MEHPYVLGDFTWTAFDYLGECGIGHALYDEPGVLEAVEYTNGVAGARLVGFGTGDPMTEEDFFNDTCTLYEGRALLVVENCEEEPVVSVWE